MPRNEPDKKRSRVRVLIVDDHPAVCEALSIRISHTPDLEVCGQATDMDDALRMIGEQKPDVAIVDIALATSDGIDLIKRIRKRDEHVRMLVWSMYGEHLYAERALRAGANGYITKEHATDTIVEAIREVLADKVYLSPTMSERLLHRAVGRGRKSADQVGIDALSDRELEVFRLIGRGVKTAQIAAQLHLSIRTVWTYRDRIREKLGLSGGAQLVHHATRWVLESE